ncbi:immunoglobulin-like domain-containing protein [Enterococcus faecalis]|uniref:immunoglobulin-like domain-containing protein n=1 Tax=Enterococcus faecalis TaxID=1351 RepID=UPI00163A4891|nr:immunoglobulin-like domain-containing protein [Enterococcus faecalis]MBC2821295.1 hypothetical protein [Enterococcus faecalis]
MKHNLREKQIRKKIKKTKKGLTLAATALILNGSLMPLNSVFAEKQEKDNLTTVSSERMEMNLNSDNSIAALQTTENTQAAENTQDISSELPKGLRNAKATRLSDGRVSVDVSTFEELKAAFNTSAVSQVNLVNDIVFTSNIDNFSNVNLVVEGNNHNLDLASYRLYTNNQAILKFNNLNIKNGNNGAYDIFRLYNSTVSLENVSYIGGQFLNANSVELGGKINIIVNNRGNNDGSLPAISTRDGINNGIVTIKKNAQVLLRSDLPYNHWSLLDVTSSSLVSIEQGATLDIIGNMTYGCIGKDGTATNISVENGAVVNLNNTGTSSYSSGIYGNGGFSNISVKKGASLNIKTLGNYAVWNPISKSVFSLQGASFDIRSEKNGGVPFYMGNGGTVSFDKQNVRAWLKGFATSTDPQYSWDNITGVVNMSGANTTSALSNNTEFNALFKNQNFSRISSNGRATQELTKTTINKVKDTDTTVSGKGEPNGKIELKVGDQVIAYGTVGSDGNYSLTIPKQIAGTVIKAVVSMDGQVSEANTTVVRTALTQTTISEISTETTQVNGKGEPNAPIKIMNGNQVIAQGIVGSDGNYTLTIPKQAKGSVIKAIVEKDGLTSEASTTVKKGSLVQTTISNIDTTMTSVSGKAEPNATIQLKVGDKVIAEGKVGSDGLYSLTIPKQSAGTVVQAVATLDGLTSTAETVVVRGELDQTTISAITTETTTVTGTGEPNATIQLKVGDKVIAEGKIGSDGKYSLTIPKQSANSVVVAVVTKDNKTSEASTVVKNTANATITKVDPYEEGKSNYVTGTYTGTGVSYIRVVVNGEKKTLIPMTGQEAGKFKYYINGLKATDKVEIALYDGSYKELARKNVTVVAPSAVSITKVDTYKEGVSNYVTGTYSGDGVAFMRVVVNGKNQALVPMNGQTQGSFKYYISNLKATDNVRIQLYNRDYTLLAQKQVPIESTANIKITGVEKYIEGKSEYVRGTYDGEGAAYIRLVVNGVNKAMVPMAGQAQGTFSYYVQGLKATDNVKVVLFDAQYRVLGEEKVIVEAPTVSNVTITSVGEYAEGKSEWITGSYEGDNASYVGLIVNGNTEMRVPISDPVSKTFKYYKNGLKATDNVQVVLYNKKAEEVARKQLVITAPAVSNIKITSLSDYKVGKTEWITGSYEGEGVSLVGLIIDGNEKDTVKVPISDPSAKTFRYYKHNLKAGQNVQVVLYGKDGQEVARKQLVIAP